MNNLSLDQASPMHRALSGLLISVFALAFSIAAAQTPPPNGLPDRGVLRLQLGSTAQNGGLHAPRRFVHEPSGLSQAINFSGKCGLALGGPSALATLSAAGGNNSLGLGSDSIGVYDGVKGVACYRITASLSESLTVGLGADLAASPQIDANAFYRLRLDVEVKRDTEILLQILADSSTVTDEFRLRSGSAIVAGEGSYQPGSPDKIFNCNASSDSGPDSGPRDNCLWQVDALGKKFRLVPLMGEGSLEGGGDFGTAAYSANTLIYLTEGNVGALGCNSAQVPQGTNTSTIGDGVATARCGVTRIDPSLAGGSCTTAIPYLFRSIDGLAEGCELIKPAGEQLAASIDITFPAEPSTALGAEPPTLIEFPDGAGGLVEFAPPACFGTVVLDPNGERTIYEVLSNPNFVPDIAPGTTEKDWGCILESEREYVSSGQMVIRQTILFWGDPGFVRK